MAASFRYSDNPITWSFSVGRLFGIRIKIHVLFVLFLVLTAAKDIASSTEGLIVGLGFAAVLFGVVLLHELGHCFGARYAGGEADEILMWPLGGLAYTRPPHTPRAHLVTTLAGPLINVILCGMAATLLVLRRPWAGLGGLPWNPFDAVVPYGMGMGFDYWLWSTFLVSYVLLLFNLIPMYPLDGGRVVQELLWIRLGHRRSTMIACTTGMIGAIGLACVGFLSSERGYMLLGIAIFGYITCWQQRQMLRQQDDFLDGEFGYDFSQGYTSLDRSTREQTRPRRLSMLQRWRIARAQRRQEREHQQHLQEERMLDQLLEKVHRDGLASLTAAERRFLDRVRAKRY